MPTELSANMKMAELLEKDPSLLGVFARMGFSFGYGDATVEDVCKGAGTDPETFLLICRVYSREDYRPSSEELKKADLSVIVRYLSLSHTYYLDVAMKDLAAGLGRMIVPCGDDTQRVIWKFFNDFKEELRKHFAYEEECVFPYIDSDDASLPDEDHSGVEETLEDLKSLVMNHLTAEADQKEAFKVLSAITSLQDDIRKHILLEESALEGNVADKQEDNALSAREKEILVCVAKGMINKEIADHLNISIHTVITHRKNITRKTGIKTVAGLTVYALLNNLLDVGSVE
ncbi:MAG: hemerythrin domain-containing protein [Bacteroidales bacterium]|nr:hemerythrin domain-containing protein [Bacteroidales bacterium]